MTKLKYDSYNSYDGHRIAFGLKQSIKQISDNIHRYSDTIKLNHKHNAHCLIVFSMTLGWNPNAMRSRIYWQHDLGLKLKVTQTGARGNVSLFSAWQIMKAVWLSFLVVYQPCLIQEPELWFRGAD